MRNADHRTSTDTRHASRQHTPVLPHTRERRTARETSPAITETGLRGRLGALARWLRSEPLSRFDTARTISRLKSV